MAGASDGLHEAREDLGADVVDRHRALVSLQEELEAVDWYDQRVAASANEELAALLAHNRDEEKEHAAMLLEWLRRNDARLDEELRTYLFREGPLLAHEAAATGKDGGGESPADTGSGGSARDASLGIGSLKGEDDAVPTT